MASTEVESLPRSQTSVYFIAKLLFSLFSLNLECYDVFRWLSIKIVRDISFCRKWSAVKKVEDESRRCNLTKREEKRHFFSNSFFVAMKMNRWFSCCYSFIPPFVLSFFIASLMSAWSDFFLSFFLSFHCFFRLKEWHEIFTEPTTTRKEGKPCCLSSGCLLNASW